MLEGIRQELDIAGLRGLVDTKEDEDALLDFFARFVDKAGYVKVTRCENCKYNHTPYYCPRYVGGDRNHRLSYCSDGVPKEGE